MMQKIPRFDASGQYKCLALHFGDTFSAPDIQTQKPQDGHFDFLETTTSRMAFKKACKSRL